MQTPSVLPSCALTALLLWFTHWGRQGDLYALDWLAGSVGEPNGAKPVAFLVGHLKHKRVDACFQLYSSNNIQL